MDEVELLLTDEFSEFSSKIRTIHENKKALTEEFKKMYANYQDNIKSLDKQALEANQTWETWKTNFMKTPKKKEVAPH